MTRRRHLLWAAPLLVVLALLAGVLALPRFVANDAHRATIEALASSLTGRRVYVAGPLSLALLPAPEIIAGDVTIGGPAGQVITARSLTLDVSLTSLLRGRLAARNISLRSPTIVLPWPLQGGAAAIVPPPWLTALHAQITDGTVHVGRLIFARVNADLFTGGNGALTVAGSGTADGTPLTLSLGLGAPDASGRAALTIDSRTQDGTDAKARLGGHFSGSLNNNSEVEGLLAATFIVPGETSPVAGTTILEADAATITASDIRLSQGAATLNGTAAINLARPSFSLDLLGGNLRAATLLPLIARGTAGLPGTLALTVTNLRLPRGIVPSLQSETDFGPDEITLRRLAASLPGDGSVTASGKINAANQLTARVNVAAADLPVLLASFGNTIPVPPIWRQAKLSATLDGNTHTLGLNDLTGSLGSDHFTGSLVLGRQGAGITGGGAFNFDQLDLAPLIALLREGRPAAGLRFAGELTADRASYGGWSFNHLLLDVALDDRLIVRRLAASLYGGTALANFTLAQSGGLTAGRAMLALPSAAALMGPEPNAAFADVAPPLPPVLTHAPLTLYAVAAGAPTSLATSAVTTLGAFTLTAAPIINLAAGTATGALTLRHPDAIAAVAPFRLKSGLAWPGAGSIALRADMAVSPGQFALPDFVLSFGDLTTAGRLTVTADHHVIANIAADTLALPTPAKFSIPSWLLATQATATITANQVWLGGDPILGPSNAHLTLAPDAATLDLTQANLANGALLGALAVNLSGATPEFNLKLNLTHADAAGLTVPLALPYTLQAGTLTGQAALHATGDNPAAWVASLAGTASLTGGNGQFSGFDMAALAQAPGGKSTTTMQNPATSGATSFTSLTINSAITRGTVKLQTARLASPNGTATATGTIDLPDQTLNLNLTLNPATTPPGPIQLTTVGSWTNPKQLIKKTP